jgi:hypothetical protein
MAPPLQPEILAEVNASYIFIIDDLVGVVGRGGGN